MARRIYIAGKYSTGNTAENIAVAREAMVKLIAAGYTPFCPHTLTAGLETEPRLCYDDFLRIDLDWLELCDCILMLPGWCDSPGAVKEHASAFLWGLNICYDIEELLEGQDGTDG